MNLNDAILGLYPDLDPSRDFSLQDDGQGTYIKEWNTPHHSKPTAQDLEAGWKLHVRKAKRRELIRAFQTEYALLWIIDDITVPEWKDLILGKPNASRTTAEQNKVTQANTLFTKIQSKLTEVRNATTEAQVEAVKWT